MPRHFHQLTMNAFVQATEDRDKVVHAIENLAGESVGEHLVEKSAEGMYHNPIIILEAVYNRERDIKRLLFRWSDMDFWKEALEQKEQRMDGSQVFHVRVDKQGAYEGSMRLWEQGEMIAIKLKIATYPASRKKALKLLDHIPELT
ncbi:MAG: RNA-binding domain-containing protein [Thermoplasmatota archaeon]